MTPAGAGSSHREDSAGRRDGSAIDLGTRVPLPVRRILERLWASGFEAYIVGGSLRDLLLDRTVADWDVATSALPARTQELFPGSAYENRFGTVAVRLDGATYEVTTFRREHVYADHRRPERVEFGVAIDEDLARRDFTMNAIAWGGRAEPVGLHDPYSGLADLRARTIRAVGHPDDRFAEDALRMLRAVRFAATLGFTIEPATLSAIRRRAPLAAELSGERVQAELRRILAAPRPSVALRLMADNGLLDVLFPDLAAQRGIAQNKIRGRDLWDHTLAAVDAAHPTRPVVRLAALLHDVGKPSTLQEGHFPGHEAEGAKIAERILRDLAFPRHEIDHVVRLVAHHMFSYSRAWSDAAVRRFMRRVGVELLDDLLALREADNVGSGQRPVAGQLPELRERIAAELGARHALQLADLAVDGNDLRDALGIEAGPEVGRILGALLDRVVADPSLNERERLLLTARRIHTRGRGDATG